MFLPGVKNIFASRTQILRPKHMFPSLATPGNITRNIVSATMFPSLDRALLPMDAPLSKIRLVCGLAMTHSLQRYSCTAAMGA